MSHTFKACPCKNQAAEHSVPHCLHMDNFDRNSNLRLLEHAVELARQRQPLYITTYLRQFAELEAIRLHQKATTMRCLGVTEVPAEWRRPDLDVRERELWEALETEFLRVQQEQRAAD